MRVTIGWTWVLLGLALLGLSGCGSAEQRQPLSGTVTFQGSALPTGYVTFLTNTAPPQAAGGALIQDGKFSVPAEQGLEPGTYKATVSAARGEGKRTPGQVSAGASTPAAEQIPLRYNDPIQTVLTIEVTQGGANRFELNLD
jgi:hypothetical protein